MGEPKRYRVFSVYLFAATLFAAAVATPRLATAAEQKIALVIGNSAYPSSRLRNPVNDAKAMAEKLRALGFDVILRTDANLRDMTRSFSQFGQKITPGSVSLFYYAGHGVQVQGKNFLVPVDAEIDSEAAVRTEAVDVDQLLYQLGPARLSMVILDACRNNPFERRFRGAASGGLAQIDAPTGTLLAYATAPGKVASDGNGANGLYTEALLNMLDAPGLKVEDVFKQVRINVVKASDGLQTPWESSSLTGEFYFRPGTQREIENAKLQRSEQERAELARALDEERKKRDKDAAAVRTEMENLRAELQRIRAEAGAPATPAVATAAIGNPGTRPAQVAAQQYGSPASASNSTATMDSAPATSAPPPQQVATAAMLHGTANATRLAAEWEERVALLGKFRGTLTFAKALAVLLDIGSEKDVTQLLIFEKWVKERGWHNAYALGTDAQGNLIWAGAYRERSAQFAAETAVKYCAQSPGDSCKVIIINGDFKDTILPEIAKRLGSQSVAGVRSAFLQSIEREPTSVISGGFNNGSPTLATFAYTVGER